MATADELLKVDLFKSLSTEAREEIAAAMEQLDVELKKTPTIIVKVGDSAREMFFVLSGSVSIVDRQNNLIRVQEAGSFFGELGLIYSCPRTVNVYTYEPVRLGVLKKDSFDALRRKHADIALAIDTIAKDRWGHFKSQLMALAPHIEKVEDISSYTDEQLQDFRNIFFSLSDGKAHLNVDQLKELLNTIIGDGYQVSAAEADLFMKKFKKGTGNDGAIDFTEFVAGLKHLSWIVRPQGEQASYSPYYLAHWYATAAAAAIAVGVIAYAVYSRRPTSRN